MTSFASLIQLLAAATVGAAVFVGIATRANLRGRPRAVGVFLLGALITLPNVIEAAVFHIAPPGAIAWLFSIAVVTQALVAWTVENFLEGGESGLAPGPLLMGASPVWWIGRLLLLGVAYLVIYFMAGATIYPFVREFYATKQLPPTRTVALLQLMVRGPMFAIVGACVVFLLRRSRRASALGAGMVLAGIGGVMSLLAPNSLFPDAVRFVHLAEVTISNFAFGVLVGWMLWRPLEQTGGGLMPPERA